MITVERITWFKPPKTIKQYNDKLRPGGNKNYTQLDQAVNIQKMLQLNRGASISDRAMGFYDTMGMEVPDLYMMDGPQRLLALNQYRDDFARLKAEYDQKMLMNKNAAIEAEKAKKPKPAPETKQTDKPA